MAKYALQVSGSELHRILKGSKKTIVQIADELGMSKQNLHGYFRAKNIQNDFLEKVLEIADIPLDAVLESVPLVGEPSPQYGTKNLKNKIPLIPNFSAVAGNGSGEFSFKAEDVEDYYSIPGMEEADFMIRVKGDSMAGVYDNGTIIICKLIQDRNLIQEGRAYLVYASDLGAVVKYLKRSGEEVVLESANTQYSPIKVHQKSIKNIARILGSVRYEG